MDRATVGSGGVAGGSDILHGQLAIAHIDGTAAFTVAVGLAVIAGDGIGPEVIGEGMKVLRAVAEIDGGFEFVTAVKCYGSIPDG